MFGDQVATRVKLFWYITTAQRTFLQSLRYDPTTTLSLLAKQKSTMHRGIHCAVRGWSALRGKLITRMVSWVFMMSQYEGNTLVTPPSILSFFVCFLLPPFSFPFLLWQLLSSVLYIVYSIQLLAFFAHFCLSHICSYR